MEIGVELRSDFLLLNLSICLSTIPQTICFPPKTTHAPTVDPTMTYTKETTGAEVASNLSPHIRNKTVLVTGVSPKGLGAEFLSTIAAHAPGLLILAGRTTSKCRQTAQALASVRPSVKTRVLELDLASQKSVRGAADEVNGWTDVPAIDVLVLNAGIMAAPYSLTEDGLESQFGGNHVGHFLLANLIMGKVLKAQEGGRVVSVSSDGFRLGPIRFDDLGFDVSRRFVFLSLNASSSGLREVVMDVMQQRGCNDIFLCKMLTGLDYREARHTTLGPPTASPRRQTHCSPFPWPKGLDRRA